MTDIDIRISMLSRQVKSQAAEIKDLRILCKDLGRLSLAYRLQRRPSAALLSRIDSKKKKLSMKGFGSVQEPAG
jgi:hypothetical protein